MLIEPTAEFKEKALTLDKTYIYSYNDIGNITEIKRYDYTTGTPSGTPVTTSFGYSGDKLTSFNGKAITHNANGEVATYDGWNYSQNKDATKYFLKLLKNS